MNKVKYDGKTYVKENKLGFALFLAADALYCRVLPIARQMPSVRPSVTSRSRSNNGKR